MAQRPEILSLRDQVQAAEKFGHAEHDLWRPNVSALGVVGLAPSRDDHVSSWYGAAGRSEKFPVLMTSRTEGCWAPKPSALVIVDVKKRKIASGFRADPDKASRQ